MILIPTPRGKNSNQARENVRINIKCRRRHGRPIASNMRVVRVVALSVFAVAVNAQLSLPALSNFISSVIYNTNAATPWSDTASCTLPPPYLKTTDDLDYAVYELQRGTNNSLVKYYIEGAGWSMFPAFGSFVNQGNYLDNETVYTLVQVVPTNGDQFNVTCGFVKGELVNPSWGAKTNLSGEAYTRVIIKSIPLLAYQTVTARYYFGTEDCNSLDNVAEYHYDLRLSRTFDNYINDVSMKRTYVGESPETMDGIIVAAPQQIEAGRFLTSVVSMKQAHEENCRIEFMAILNDEVYSVNMADYISKYFGVSQSSDELKTLIDGCVANTERCNE